MGNCMFGGIEEESEIIEVMTSSNGIMEFVSPITVERITEDFPGHGVFKRHDLFWKPIPHNQVLTGGESYYLLPLSKVGHHLIVRSNSSSSGVAQAPYRMSFDSHGVFKRPYTTQGQVHHKKKQLGNKSGFWKVKLVISPQQLLEILSQESRTQELIDNVRTVAKCGNTFSDQWSLSSSSRNASDRDFILHI